MSPARSSANPTARPTPKPIAHDVEFHVADGVGHVELNRPRAINALSIDMMVRLDVVLSAWAHDDTVTAVELHGRGERGFCSGADVREIRQLILDASPRAAGFFEREYRLNALLAAYPKPLTAHLHGISMGGGLGLAEHASRRIAADDLRWAMPEVTIGLFPDCGVLYELARTPGEVGAWLAMTGESIDAASALWAGLVDEVTGAIPGGAVDEECALSRDQWWINECFTGDDAAAILHRLETHESEDARRCAELIRTRSALSVCVTLEALRRAALAPDVATVLRQDAALARSFIEASDFCEGVRAQLVDKTRDPHWWFARVEDVPRELVEARFGSPRPNA